jgi:hypothetical protein
MYKPIPEEPKPYDNYTLEWIRWLEHEIEVGAPDGGFSEDPIVVYGFLIRLLMYYRGHQ